MVEASSTLLRSAPRIPISSADTVTLFKFNLHAVSKFYCAILTLRHATCLSGLKCHNVDCWDNCPCAMWQSSCQEWKMQSHTYLHHYTFIPLIAMLGCTTWPSPHKICSLIKDAPRRRLIMRCWRSLASAWPSTWLRGCSASQDGTEPLDSQGPRHRLLLEIPADNSREEAPLRSSLY